MKNSQVYAKHMGARISPKKVAIIADLVRGKEVHEAKVALTFDPSKASDLLLKILKSAEANAKHNNKITGEMFLSEVWVGPGATLKRGKIVAKSRFSPILKRTANIYIGLTEKPKKFVNLPVEKAAEEEKEEPKTITKKLTKKVAKK